MGIVVGAHVGIEEFHLYVTGCYIILCCGTLNKTKLIPSLS